MRSSMRNVLFLGSVLSLAACGEGAKDSVVQPEEIGQTGAPLKQADPSLRIEGSYIIKMKDGVQTRGISAFANIAKTHEYSIINGFAAKLTPEQLKAVRANPNVEYVEEDAAVYSTATQSGATWGIDRIDQRARPLSGTYTYTSTGSGVTVYVIDTGILTSHSQFGGRAAVAYDALGGNGQDCNGHGTHVAGTVGGSTYGVAKGVALRAVRVLDCNGSGSNAGVIAGMDWVRVNHVAKSVANMSLGGGYSATVNTAATNLVNSGVFLAVAAGNSNADACSFSPASASGTCTVGATTNTDARATYSNYGGCVDIYGPGSSITSAWYTTTSATNTISGTSMASPHVAGVGALYKATYGDAAASTIISWLKTNSTANVVTGNPSGTPNQLLYKAAL
ncbi:S8 family peptidase [Hyalangium rubrum]|uniref:S8 family peptidase n=1 Tax=Hyalangium rubrum TaxID=3103134 RepID=A0ABU5H1N8_9BACT|nr:S8 family peptidase [Hyalangium sp. s54d21]MDY7227310.1 S8 family peptidase [Hyalangium sp. s54d21]